MDMGVFPPDRGVGGTSRPRVALLGGGGFIGVHLADGLIRSGQYDVTVADIDRTKLDFLLNGAACTFIDCNIQHDDALAESVVRHSDIVVDLIAYANPAVYLTHPLEVVKLNLFDNLKIVDWCVKHRKRLVQFSTCEVYGKTGGRSATFSEDASDCVLGPVCNHRWIYACSKQMLERILHAHGLHDELAYTVIRPFNFIGPLIDYLIDNPHDGNPRVFSHFMSALLKGWPLRLVDGGHARRSYTYIRDAVDAILLILAERDAMRNQIVNIGNPENETSIRDLALRCRDLYGELTGTPCTLPIVDVSAEEFYGRGYEDCDRRIPDISKLRALGWSPKFDLDETLRLTMQFHIDHHERLRQKTPAYRLLVGDSAPVRSLRT